MNCLRLLLTLLICTATGAVAFAQPPAQPPKMTAAERKVRKQIIDALRNQGVLPGSTIVIRNPDDAEVNDNPFADEEADPDADPADAEIQEAVNGRMEQLSELPFNRLPSHIFDTWSKPTHSTVTDPTRDELPPRRLEQFYTVMCVSRWRRKNCWTISLSATGTTSKRF